MDSPSAPSPSAEPPPDSRGPAPAGGTTSASKPAPFGRDRRERNVGWRSRDVIRAAALVAAMLIALRLLWFAQLLVLTSFLGVLFGLAVTAGVDYLQRWRVPRGVGAVSIVFGTLALLGSFLAWTAPTLREQSGELRTKLPEAIDKVERWVEKRQTGLLGSLMGVSASAANAVAPRPDSAAAARRASPASVNLPAARAGAPPQPVPARDSAAPAVSAADQRAARIAAEAAAQTAAEIAAQSPSAGSGESGGRLRDRVLSQASGAKRFLFGFLTSTFAALGGLLLIVFLAIYVAVEPDTYHDGLMHLFPHRARKRAGEVLSAIAAGLRRWLVTQLIAMIVIGAVTTVVLLVIGVKAALPLGILAGLLEFVPTVGPFLSAIPAVAMGFVDSPEKALTVGIAYVLIQFAENHLLIPILMKQGVNVPPALTIVAQALMALVFGFLGLLVAVPILVAVMVAVKMLYVEGVVGDDVEVFDAGDDDA